MRCLGVAPKELPKFGDEERLQWRRLGVGRAATGQQRENALAAGDVNRCRLGICPCPRRVVATAPPPEDDHECFQDKLLPDALKGRVWPLRGIVCTWMPGESGHIPHPGGRAWQPKTENSGVKFAFVCRPRPSPET